MSVTATRTARILNESATALVPLPMTRLVNSGPNPRGCRMWTGDGFSGNAGLVIQNKKWDAEYQRQFL